MVGVTDTTAFANTTSMGIIRPRIHAHNADGGFWWALSRSSSE